MGADTNSVETFSPAEAAADDALPTAAEVDAYMAQAWDLQQPADEEQALQQDFWWYMAQEKQYYAEDLWDMSENFGGYQDPFWGYSQGFNEGLLSVGESYYGLADKSGVLWESSPKGLDRASSSTASTEKESDAESGGDEVDARQAIYW